MATPPTTSLHFVIFPFMAAGHMIPMLDIARIIAQRGVTVSIVTTPAVANRSKEVINRAKEANLKIELLELPLPAAEVGLLEGWEDNDTSQRSSEEKAKVFHAMELIEKPAEDLLRKLAPPPDCIISDFFFSWSTNVAIKFNIPRFVFHSTICFFQVCLNTVLKNKILEGTESATEKITLPGLPDRVEITKLKIAGRSTRTSNSKVERSDQAGFFARCMQADLGSYGIVANSFVEMEPEYVKELIKQRGANVYCVGPVSLVNKDDLDIAQRGKKAAIDDPYCLQWLNEREVESVLYVSLGTAAHVSTQQSIELGLGLESTNKPFIWCVRDATKELAEWFLESRFEERVRDRGLIVHGWAPQVLILSHPAIKGFLTHCGSNSLLESMCAGVPVVTWPFFMDHFFSEIFVIDILKIGVSLGVAEPVFFGDVEKMEPLVKKEDVKRAVSRLFDDENEGAEKKERKERARKVAEMAKQAMAEGGSSYLNVSSLIQDVSDFVNQKKDGRF